LCDGKLDILDTFCGRTSMSKCFLCSSLSRYLTSDSTFTIESGSYAGYTLRKKIFPDVKISTSSTSKSVLSDKFTQKLIISDLTENILLDHRIPCNITFGSVCSNIGYLYELSLGSLTFDKMCEQPELVRPLKESKIVIVSRLDTRVPLK